MNAIVDALLVSNQVVSGKILFISGVGRSGSTMFGDILGTAEGFCHIGELQRLWLRGLEERGMCGCGLLVSECQFWKKVFQGDNAKLLERRQDIQSLDRRTIRTRNLLRVLVDRRAYTEDKKAYAEVLKNIYQKVQELTKCRVIVDGSKYPTYCAVLNEVEYFEIYVVHLVRDPRAVAFSWQRNKYSEEKKGMFNKMSYFKSACISLFWDAYISMSNYRNSRYRRVKYEDFVENPIGSLDIIESVIGLPLNSIHVSNNKEISVKMAHSIAGNPGKFIEQVKKLRTDDEWIGSMPSRWKFLVTVITLPILVAFKYPIWPRR